MESCHGQSGGRGVEGLQPNPRGTGAQIQFPSLGHTSDSKMELPWPLGIAGHQEGDLSIGTLWNSYVIMALKASLSAKPC